MPQTKPIRVRGQPIAGGKVPVICTPLVGRTPEAVLAEAAAVLPKAPDVIEWRVDYFEAIGDTQRVVDTARRLRAAAGATPIIFTRRSTREGGEKIGIAEPQVLDLYAAVCASRAVDIADYELSNEPEHRRRVREVTRANEIGLILSYHNFQSTPDAAALAAKFAGAQAEGADIAKVAVMPQDLRDVLTLLGATLQASRTLAVPLISMSMGGFGSVSRMVGGVFGSALTFAVGKAASAPGQIPIEELRSVLATVERAVGAPR